ncbi:MAG: response regulator [Burkholderiaceae bacterium]
MTINNLAEAAQFRRILNRNLTLPLLVGLASVVFFIGLTLYLLSVVSWVGHTQQVIAKAHELSTLVVEQETGTRGYLITGEDKFRAPYDLGRPKFLAELDALKVLVGDNPVQVDRLNRIRALQQQWDQFAQQVMEAKRQNQPVDLLLRSEAGKQLYDEIRRELRLFVMTESGLLDQRTQDAQSGTWQGVSLYIAFVLIVSGLIAYNGRRDIRGLSRENAQLLADQARSLEVAQRQAWIDAAQAQLAQQLVGQLSLPMLGRNVLAFLAGQLGAVVGALYVRSDAGLLRRIASYGFSKESEAAEQAIELEQGLVGQAARDGRLIRVQNLEQDYLRVVSGLGQGAPRELLLLPVRNDEDVNGVLELGLMRPLDERETRLLELAQASIGAATEAALYRRRLQDAVEETRQLNEELQVQQEELRTANEELGEQSRVLTESQTSLEHQQAELEQTNNQLSEQAALLDRRNEALKETQARLQERAEELQQASRYKSEFLANMSHELRTPLNSSLILAKLLAENKHGNLNEEQLRFASTIHAAGMDLLNLINDILDLSKVEAGKLELQPQTIDIRRMAEGLRRGFAPLAEQKKLAFVIEIAEDAPASLVSDLQRLEQVLKNLLSNAIKFTERGRVTLAIRPRPGDHIAFSVIDTGIGIPSEQQALIFEAFHQGDGTINRRYGGTGLGLSISRQLAALLGGSIQLSSLAGQGSSFTLELPALLPPPSSLQTEPARPVAPPPQWVPAPAPAPAQPAVAPAARQGPIDDRDKLPPGARLALVVEDDPDFATILYELAREMQYHCLLAGSVQEALQLAAEHLPQAILLDIRLPDGSGLSVLQSLKENPATRHIPVHIVAGEDFREIALPLGAIGVAIKPTTRAQLIEVFRQLEQRVSKKVKRLLLVEDDERQRDSIVHLIDDADIEITAVADGGTALQRLREEVFDCMVIDLKLPDMDGSELLERMAGETQGSFPPVIVYTGRHLTRQEEARLNRYSRSIIIKGARSPERLLDEVSLFLHRVESQLSSERQTMLRSARNREKVFEGRKILLVDDDVRNVFALTSALEQRGFNVEIGRNGVEALARLDAVEDIDIVLMDVMMPVMDGLEAMRRIRADARFQKLPIIAITAKAMKDDQEQCRRAGANDYLAKPIELDRLISLLRVWLPGLERH